MEKTSNSVSAEGRVRSMANRHTLHISQLADFKKWLEKDGWKIEEPKGIWEVLRARKQGRKNPLIVFQKKDAKEHLSIMDRDSGVVGAFLRDSNRPKTNADCIRSMNDAELAEFIANKGSYMACCQCDYFNHDEEKCESPSVFLCTKGYAEALILKWLQSEVE